MSKSFSIGMIYVGYLAICWIAQLAQAQTFAPWWNQDWACRAIVQCPGGAGDVALVTLNLAGRTETDGRDIRVVDEAGQLQPFDLLHHDPDWNTLIRCRVAPDRAQRFYVYYGNPKSLLPERQPGWQPQRGLIARFYQKPPAEKEYHPTTLTQLKSLIDRSQPQGAILATAISQGFNPVGESDGYISVYEGYASIDQRGTYRFCTASDDGSWVIVNGQQVIAWPGAHNWSGSEKGQVNGAIELTPGVIKVEYYHEEGVGTQMAFLGVQAPGAKHFTAIPNDRWLSVRQAKAAAYESRLTPLMAVADVQLVNSYWISDDGPVQATLVQTASQSFCRSGQIITTQWEFDDGLTAHASDGPHIYFRFGRPVIRLSVTDAQGRRDRIVCKPSIFPVDVQSTWFRYGSIRQYAPLLQAYDLSRMQQADLNGLALFWAKSEDWPRHVQTVKAMMANGTSNQHPSADLLLSAAEACLENAAYDPTSALAFNQQAIGLLTEPAAKAQTLRRQAQILSLHLDRPEEARSIAQQLLGELERRQPAVPASHPLWRQVHSLLGDTCLMQDQRDQAQAHYLQAEQWATASMNKAQRLAQLGGAPYSVEDLLSRDQFDWALKAIDEWEDRFATQKLDGLTFFWRGKVLYVQQPGEAALRWLTLAERLAPATAVHLPETRWLKANTLLAMKRLDQAKAAFEQLNAMGIKSEWIDKAQLKIRECSDTPASSANSPTWESKP